MERSAGLVKTSPSAQLPFAPHSRKPVPVVRPLQRTIQALPSRRCFSNQPAVEGNSWTGAAVQVPLHLLQPVRGSLLQVCMCMCMLLTHSQRFPTFTPGLPHTRKEKC